MDEASEATSIDRDNKLSPVRAAALTGEFMCIFDKIHALFEADISAEKPLPISTRPLHATQRQQPFLS